MRFVTSKNLAQTLAQFLTMRVGDVFIDHQGRTVEKIGESIVSVGPGVGYNNDMDIADYIYTVQDGLTYGRYLLAPV